MRVLGVDPGSVVCGYGVVDKKGNKFTLVESGVIKAKKPAKDFSERLDYINRGIEAVIKRNNPDVSAFETIFYAKNVQSLVKLSHARAVAILAAVQSEIEVCEYSPNSIKKAVTGKGKANKKQVSYMVQKLLNIKEAPKYYDATDALAVAICHCLKGNSIASNSSKTWADYIKNNPDKVASG